jgi:hypothetical protein
LSSSVCVPVFAQQARPSEYQVKAVYIYNFGKFVQWPSSVTSEATDFGICVIGQSPFGSALDDVIRGENIDGRQLITKQIDRAENIEGCRILFIASSEEGRLSKILTSVATKPVLTVSDIQRFTDTGGIIGFVSVNDKVRFDINLTNSDKAGLTLSSQLLKVAVSVKGSASKEK